MKKLSKKQIEERLKDFFLRNPDQVFSFKDIFRHTRLEKHPEKMFAIELMKRMAWDDFISKVSDNSYKLNQKGQVLIGKFLRKGNGKNVFIPEEEEDTVFVSERNSKYAASGDKVRVQMLARRDHHMREAMVIEILERSKQEFVGKIKIGKDLITLVTQENLFASDIIIPKRRLKGAKNKDNVIVKVVKWADNDNKHIIGDVIKVLGASGDNDAEMHTILAQHGLPYSYPENVEKAADKISEKITDIDLKEREDFRETFTCTIDPHDAKDFDDALSIKQLPDGLWQIGVHIADVSHYVKEGSVIDKEAFNRATSIYLVDRTIPMLPERLCNYICSLRPDEDKLAYSVIFDINDEGDIKKYRITHTVIRSNHRYVYDEVQSVIEGGEDENKDMLLKLDSIAKKLREKRFSSGAIKFERGELRFDVDDEGKPIRAYFKKSEDANKLIEEYMLLANRTVAEHVGKIKKRGTAKTLPYRVHDNPDPQKLEELKEFVAKFGYKLKTDGTKNQTARRLNTLMDQSHEKKEAAAIQLIALRAMQKAKYTVHNIGHFGLAFDYYTHFTSPIRRYPDILVHRLLTRYEQGGRSGNKFHYEELCRHSSEMEILAQNAERDSIKYKMVEYLAENVGGIYPAHISGITAFGIYCEIDENHCEGLIPIRDLDDDYYIFDEKNYCLTGRHRHRTYQLGDAITIQIASANIEKRQIDFIEKK